MKKSNKILILIISTLFLFTACGSRKNFSNINSSSKKKNQIEKTSQIVKKEDEGKKSLSYKQYRELYNLIKNNLELKGFNQVSSTDGETLVAVAKDLTFNKRNWITLNGKSYQSTQDTIFFESKDKKTLVAINFAYTPNFIGNDIVFYIPSIYKDFKINSNLKNLTDFMIISYKNLIINIHQTSSTAIDKDITKNFTRKLEKVIVENKAKE